MNIRIASLTLLALLLAVTSPARGGLVVSNIGNTFASSWTVGISNTVANSPVANQFMTGSGPGWTLDSVDLSVGVFSGPATGSLGVFIFSDNMGLPGSPLAILSGPNPTTTLETITRTPLVPVLLAPNTPYWIVLESAVGNDYGWSYTADTSETGLAGWSIGDTSYSGYGFLGWTALEGPAFPPDPGFPAPTLFQINAATAAVPEPSTLVLSGMGMALIGLRVCRRRRTTASRKGEKGSLFP